MAEASQQPNYPDILGYITGGARYNANVVQIALSVRPRVARAGRPFEAILLIQNASDVNVDVTATLQLPETDAKKKPKRFIAKSERLVVGLRPAEVGYVVLPISSMPDTAVSDSYKIGMSVDVKPLSKPKRIRLQEGGGEVNLDYLNESAIEAIQQLKKQSFTATRRGLMGSTIEAPFNILSAQIGQIVDLKPGWVSLWKMSDHKDDRVMIERYNDIIRDQLLPQLQVDNLYAPLYDTTQALMAGKFDVAPIEVHYIVKSMIAVLKMSVPDDDAIDFLAEDVSSLSTLMKKRVTADTDLPHLPHWFQGLLKAIDHDTEAAQNPAGILAGQAYDKLLRDTIWQNFKMITRVTGEDVGSDDDKHEYEQQLVTRFCEENQTMSFGDVYLPLVMSGVIVYDRAINSNEKVVESLNEIARQLRTRRSEMNEDNDLVFKLAEQVIDRALQKYGFRA